MFCKVFFLHVARECEWWVEYNVLYCRQPELTNSRSRIPVSVFHLRFCHRRSAQHQTIIINIKICAICYMCMGFSEASEKAILNVNWSLNRKFIKDLNSHSIAKNGTQKCSIRWHSIAMALLQHTDDNAKCRMKWTKRPNVSIYVDNALTSFIVCSRSWKLRRKILLWAW